MLKHRQLTFMLGALLALQAAPWAAAQTEPAAPAPAAPSAVPQAPIQPLDNPMNRNPARRVLPPDNSLPPPDPRDSTTRPALPPGTTDGRDAVMPAEPPASDVRKP